MTTTHRCETCGETFTLEGWEAPQRHCSEDCWRDARGMHPAGCDCAECAQPARKEAAPPKLLFLPPPEGTLANPTGGEATTLEALLDCGEPGPLQWRVWNLYSACKSNRPTPLRTRTADQTRIDLTRAFHALRAWGMTPPEGWVPPRSEP